jgi:hypothetical protein
MPNTPNQPNQPKKPETDPNVEREPMKQPDQPQKSPGGNKPGDDRDRDRERRTPGGG